MLNNTHLYYGGDYNPEQWPESVWTEDAQLMQVAGVNLVSVGIFSWAKLEPAPGDYRFEWLDRVIDLLHQHGVAVDLATATASPPAWLIRQHPDVLPEDANRTVLYPGSRQHYCPNSPHYRKAAAALTRQLAQRYQHHPAVVMWHINNEYACHVPACFCDRCAAAFRTWLQARYTTLDALNEAWGTAFWSQSYSDWEEIFPPRKAPTMVNPAEQVDYKRFYSDSVLALHRQEYAIIKEFTPELPVTTNFMGFFGPLDYNEWAKHVDFTSWDAYPDPNEGIQGLAVNAAAHDLTRSLGKGKPFILMEQVTSQVNWRPINSLKHPGQMRLHSYQALSRGADGILFFQWRAAKAGAEKYHGAMVPHIGTDRSRIFREVTELGQELKKLDAIVGSQVQAKVGIVIDWPNWWALELDSKPAQLNYLARLFEYHRFFYDANIPVDFVAADGDWSPYKLILAPHLCQMREGTDERIRSFVKEGGTFLTTYFSDITNENEQIILGGYAGRIGDVLGLRVEEWDPQAPDQKLHVQWADGRISEATDWCDLVHLEGASALAVLTDHFCKDTPAVTQNTYGKGQAYYLATQLDATARKALLESICQALKITPPVSALEGVEAVVREKDGRRFLFLLNHLSKPATVDLKAWKGIDLLSHQTRTGRCEMAPAEVCILELQP